jgi:hypothetical protein
VNGIAATGCAAVISPFVMLISGGRRVAGGVEPMPVVPDMIACDLRW